LPGAIIIDSNSLEAMDDALERFHKYRKISRSAVFALPVSTSLDNISHPLR